jgi:hypothetical protein
LGKEMKYLKAYESKLFGRGIWIGSKVNQGDVLTCRKDYYSKKFDTDDEPIYIFTEGKQYTVKEKYSKGLAFKISTDIEHHDEILDKEFLVKYFLLSNEPDPEITLEKIKYDDNFEDRDYFIVRNDEESEKVQEFLFDNGFIWRGEDAPHYHPIEKYPSLIILSLTGSTIYPNKNFLTFAHNNKNKNFLTFAHNNKISKYILDNDLEVFSKTDRLKRIGLKKPLNNLKNPYESDPEITLESVMEPKFEIDELYPIGTELLCKEDIYMKNSTLKCFTAGKWYQVVGHRDSVFTNSRVVEVIDDRNTKHGIGYDWLIYFGSEKDPEFTLESYISKEGELKDFNFKFEKGGMVFDFEDVDEYQNGVIKIYGTLTINGISVKGYLKLKGYDEESDLAVDVPYPFFKHENGTKAWVYDMAEGQEYELEALFDEVIDEIKSMIK